MRRPSWRYQEPHTDRIMKELAQDTPPRMFRASPIYYDNNNPPRICTIQLLLHTHGCAQYSHLHHDPTQIASMTLQWIKIIPAALSDAMYFKLYLRTTPRATPTTATHIPARPISATTVTDTAMPATATAATTIIPTFMAATTITATTTVATTLGVTAQEGTKVLGKYRRKIWKVWKELCYGKAETLEDAEEAARWWRYNLV